MTMPDQVSGAIGVEVNAEATNGESEGGAGDEREPHFEPIVTLPLVQVSTNEEHEAEMCKMRARLYRFDTVDHEWKERGTGDIKLLHHRDNCTVRVVMRRDKTLKLCANHFITEEMQLKPHISSECAFNWTTFGDFADETAKTEFLAVKFGNVDNAKIWREKFAEAVEIVKSRAVSLNSTKNTTVEEVDDESSANEASSDNSKVLDEKSVTIESDKSSDKVENAEVILQLSELAIEKESDAVKEK